MNYYIINTNSFALSDKSKIIYLHKSIDETKYIIVTSETIDPSGWVGDNTGITQEEMEDIKYIEGI